MNGLRADDAESFYPRRGSLDSEYSTMPPHDTDNEQLFFKEHARTGSKSSSISNYSRRKVVTAPRPETKVLFLFHLKFSNLQYFCGSLPVNHLVYIFARNYELNISPSLLFFLLLLGFLQFLSEHRTTY